MRPHYDRMVRERNRAGDDAELLDWAKENVIESTLLHQEAARRFAESGSQADPRQNLQLCVDRLIDEVSSRAERPKDNDMRNYYLRHKDTFFYPEQVHASHIIKRAETPSERPAAFLAISEAKNALDSGEPFESVALRLSDCPSNAGDLGVFARGQMVKEFEDAVFSMQPGGISGIFLTDFGYHIAAVHRKIPARPLKYEAVKAGIMQRMMEERRQLCLNNYIEQLKQKAVIGSMAE